jgi:hypothetical protein
MEKPFSAITDEEWIRYHWVDVSTLSDHRFLMTRERTPEEAANATREIADIRHPGWDRPPRLGFWRRVREAFVK